MKRLIIWFGVLLLLIFLNCIPSVISDEVQNLYNGLCRSALLVIITSYITKWILDDGDNDETH